MKFDPDRHHRRSIRLPEYDYAFWGSFFVTICTHNREFLFGDVIGGEMQLNGCGRIVAEEWRRSGELRGELTLGAFIVMPNHVHGIMTIETVGAHGNAPSDDTMLRRPVQSLATFVSGFKGSATRRINALRDTPGSRVWQRNYYERVIRDEEEFNRVRSYIDDNPRRWAEDEYNPKRTA
jgi:REP element-mobilizing transposase RayT